LGFFEQFFYPFHRFCGIYWDMLFGPIIGKLSGALIFFSLYAVVFFGNPFVFFGLKDLAPWFGASFFFSSL